MSKKVLDRDMVLGCTGANEQRQGGRDDGILAVLMIIGGRGPKRPRADEGDYAWC